MSPPTYFVVCLHEHCSQEAADFLADKLKTNPDKGGAGLIVNQEHIRPHGLILHVSLQNEDILRLAEEVGVKKADKKGVVRDFEAHRLDMFPESGLVGPLTLSDVHRCVLHAMDSLHFDKDQRYLPGYEKKKVMKGAPIFSAYREAGLIDTFPLHDDESIDKLWKSWNRSKVFDPPIEDIRDYFGENVALYFSFMSFYTAFLVPIAFIGILQWCFEHLLHIKIIYSNLFFAGLNLVAVTVFLEMWKRRSNSHNYKWGTGGKLRHKKSRPEFRGELGINKITGKEEMQYPMKKTIQKVFLISVPITLVCLLFAFLLMLLSFQVDVMLRMYYTSPLTGEFEGGVLGNLVLMVPSIGYSILVMLMNQYYLRLAHFLSEWENHRTQEQFEKYVVAKLVLFEFVNTFLSLFYIAFYLQNVAVLKSQVFSMLIVQQVVNQLQETVLPIVLKRPSTKKMIFKVSRKIEKTGIKLDPKKKCEHGEVKGLQIIDSDDTQAVLANFSLKRDPYESTYDDFMEIWLQFGHVFLFSSVYPLAAFFALINNALELYIDSYKICRLTRKPTPRAVRDIGAWYAAFSITSIVSVMTNCALIAMDPDVQAFAPGWSVRDWILLFVGVEHVFLLIRVAIDRFISDVPKEIKDALDRDAFILKTEKKK